jgi:maltose O-acetyltransferase
LARKEDLNFFDLLQSSYQDRQYQRLRKEYSISDNFVFNGKDINFYGDGNIVCGENSYIGSYSTIQAGKNCMVTIGKNCHISHNVRIYTESNVADQPFDSGDKELISQNVTVEDYVWIGANVFINPGSTIGKIQLLALILWCQKTSRLTRFGQAHLLN